MIYYSVSAMSPNAVYSSLAPALMMTAAQRLTACKSTLPPLVSVTDRGDGTYEVRNTRIRLFCMPVSCRRVLVFQASYMLSALLSPPGALQPLPVHLGGCATG